MVAMLENIPVVMGQQMSTLCLTAKKARNLSRVINFSSGTERITASISSRWAPTMVPPPQMSGAGLMLGKSFLQCNFSFAVFFGISLSQVVVVI